MTEEEFPPSFNVEFDERQKAIYDCYVLMEQLVDEYGGEGQIRRVEENKTSVELHFDIPKRGSEE